MYGPSWVSDCVVEGCLAFDGGKSGSFDVSASGETSAAVYFRIHVTVRDADGATYSTFRDVRPRTVNVTLTTAPTGLQLLLDGQPVTSQATFTGVVGVQRTLEAPSPQTVGETSYGFAGWSDGGARSHSSASPTSSSGTVTW